MSTEGERCTPTDGGAPGRPALDKRRKGKMPVLCTVLCFQRFENVIFLYSLSK